MIAVVKNAFWFQFPFANHWIVDSSCEISFRQQRVAFLIKTDFSEHKAPIWTYGRSVLHCRDLLFVVGGLSCTIFCTVLVVNSPTVPRQRMSPKASRVLVKSFIIVAVLTPKRVSSLRDSFPSHCARTTQLLSKECCSGGKPLATLYVRFWPTWDLNLRPPAPETNTLPLDQLAGLKRYLSKKYYKKRSKSSV